jgi:hypothetical protein
MRNYLTSIATAALLLVNTSLGYSNIPRQPSSQEVKRLCQIYSSQKREPTLAPPLTPKEEKIRDENFRRYELAPTDDSIPKLEDTPKQDGERGLLRILGSPLFPK